MKNLLKHPALFLLTLPIYSLSGQDAEQKPQTFSEGGIYSLSGQDATENTDPVFDLSPFEVTSTRDTYTATNAVSGTRMRTEIRNLPMNLQVVTEGLIKDLGTSDIDAALRFTSGVQSNVGNTGGYGKFNVRGIQQTYSLRNGFRRYGPNDAGNAAQVEVVKGPASLFYGQVFPGGVVNVTTKRPLWEETRLSLEASAGSHGSYRFSADAGGKITDTLAYRLNAAYGHEVSFIDYYERDTELIAPVFTWRPFKRLSITVEYEHLRRDEQAPPAGLFVISEDYDIARNAEDPNDPFNLRSTPAAFYSEFSRRAAENIPQRYWDLFPEGTYIESTDALGNVTRRTLRFTRLQTDLRRSFNANGPDTYYWTESEATTANVELEITSWLRYRGSFLYSLDDSGRYSSFVNNTYRSGVDAILYASNGLGSNKVVQTINDLMAEFATGPIDHRLLTGVETYSDHYTSMEQPLPDFPGYPGYSRAVMRLPVETDLTYTWSGLFLPTAPIVDFTLLPYAPLTGDYTTSGDRETSGYALYLSDQMTLFKGRLIFLGGIRYEKFETDNFQTGKVAGRDDTTMQGGFVYKVTENIGIFASYAESFYRNEFPQYASPDGSLDPNELAPPETGLGMELGVKFDILDNRLSGIISAFNLTRENQLNNFRDQSFTPARTFSFLSGKYEVDGIETEFQYVPVPNWTLIVGYTYLDARQTTDSLTLRAGDSWPNVPEHQFNLWTRYDFQDGPLEGLYLGGGARYMGARRGGNDTNIAQGWDITSEAYWEFELLLGYQFTVYGKDNTLALNIYNLFDEEFIRGGQTLPSEPRSFRLSYRIDF
jgi:iron complex outermembrane receptor protein